MTPTVRRAGCAAVVTVAAALTPAAAQPGRPAPPGPAHDQLRDIAKAMHAYQDVNKFFPPAAVANKAGHPLLSWRVLILPYLKEDALFRRFDLDEPWDGPTNKALLHQMPAVYKLPFPTAAGATETHYQVFTGPRTMFDSRKKLDNAWVRDGLTYTLLVATMAKAVPWTKPEDVPFDPTADMTKTLGFFDDTSLMALASGAVRGLPRSINPKTLALLIDPNDRQSIPDDFWQ